MAKTSKRPARVAKPKAQIECADCARYRMAIVAFTAQQSDMLLETMYAEDTGRKKGIVKGIFLASIFWIGFEVVRLFV
jgi:hypothetical protein